MRFTGSCGSLVHAVHWFMQFTVHVPASSYSPSHPPSDFRYTFPRLPTRNFAQEPRSVYIVLLLEYIQKVQEERGEYNRKKPAGWITAVS